MVIDPSVYLASGLAQCAISALLLANNIADQDEDETLKRRTIVHYLGRQRSIVFFIVYTAGFLMLIVSVLLGLLPKLTLLTLITVPLVVEKSRGFAANPVKKLTFQTPSKSLFVTTFSAGSLFGAGVSLNF